MKRAIIAILIAAVSAGAQGILTLSGPTAAYPGQTVTLSLTVSGTTALNLAAAQWNLVPPSGEQLLAPAVSAPATALGLGAFCGAGNTLCLLVGLIGSAVTDNPWTDGQLATIPLSIPIGASPGSQLLALSGLMGASTSGSAIALTSGTAYTLQVLSRCDVNGDGKVDSLDVLAVVSSVVTRASCPLPPGGTCSLQAVQEIIVSAAGGSCTI